MTECFLFLLRSNKDERFFLSLPTYLNQMKKATILFGLFLLAALPLFAERVDPETARKVATTFLNNNGAKAAQLTALSKAAGFANLYIFNGEEGFVVMSADDCVQPILGYSLTGRFEAKDMPENLRWWLQGYSDQIQDAVENKSKATPEIAKQWNDMTAGKGNAAVADVVVGPLLTTLWDQTYPYNYYCPTCSSGGNGGHVYTGCVATAMAQVLKYWNYPTTGNGSHSYTHSTYNEQTANFGETTYDWNNMPNSLSSSSNQTSIDAVATLIYHCGVSVDMNYGTGSSGAYSIDVPPALINYFNYAPSATYVSRDGFADSQWIAFLKNELDEGRPMYYSGSNTGSGHAFVCDGYRSDDYFHFNWGWSGSDGSYGNAHGNNGYWAIGALSPGSGGSGSGSGTYNLSNAVIAWLEPISDLSAPTIAATLSEDNATLTWNAIAGASSYDVYKDNARIASDITSISYTDSNIGFGQYPEYYIRAKSSTSRSNPSNRVTLACTYQNRIPQNPNAAIEVTDNSVYLTWDETQSQSMDLHYGTGQVNSYYGSNVSEGTYWGQCYPSQSLDVFAGMAIDHVSIFLGFSGNYRMLLYKDNVVSQSNLLVSKDFIGVTGWNEIPLDEEIPLNITQDLWVVFHTSNDIQYPAFYGEYYGNNKEHAHYLWYDFSEDITYTLHSDNISWPIKIHLTDGTLSYNVYRDNTLIAERQANHTYRDTNLSDGIHDYFIKTYANNWESDASSTVSISYSTEHHITGTTTITDNLTLSSSNKYTVEPTAVLTLTGAITNTDPANLIIEDGAQLIHPNSAVQATLQKTIEAYSTEPGVNNGWYTIASPVNALSVDLATTGSYDLYAYDEEGVYWRNQKNSANNITNFTEGTGFLYANATQQSLAFAGNMKATNTQVTMPLSYQSSNADLKGFNLVGNPFTRNLNAGDITLGGTALTTYYVVEGGSELVPRVLAETPIKPGQGFLVQASTTGQDLVFNPSSKDQAEAKPTYLCIEVSDDNFTDCAYLQFGQGNTLHKMTLSDNTTTLSVRHNKVDYAVANVSTDVDELPLNFKATRNDTYTFNINIVNVDLDYLHLIDNLTGADIDLLQTPSYSFEAKTSDYESRFRLVFNEKIVNNPDNDFDFSSGNIQILDVTGRIVATDLNDKLAPGVYILKNTDNQKTKKIIINK